MTTPIEAPPVIDPLPATPSRQRRAQFSSESDAYIGHMPTFRDQQNALAAWSYAVALATQAEAEAAASAASTATAARDTALSARDTAVDAADAATAAASAASDDRALAVSAANTATGARDAAALSAAAAAASAEQAGQVVDHGFSVTTTTVSKTLIPRERCTVKSAGLTITLPASPASATECWVAVEDFTDTIVARNGQTILGVAEDRRINARFSTVGFYFDGQTWRAY